MVNLYCAVVYNGRDKGGEGQCLSSGELGCTGESAQNMSEKVYTIFI